MLEDPIVTFSSVEGSLNLSGTAILVDSQDYAGVHIAVRNVATDLQRVCGRVSTLYLDTVEHDVETLIVIGSLEKCRFVQELLAQDITASIKGRWESFVTTCVNSPFTFAKKIFVIAGSDKRGTIFGCYTLTEQIGVSPWHWWADVSVKTHDEIYALPILRIQGEPSVRYRGIFINDEAPALTGWVHEKFGSKFNSEFYKLVFDLLLRSKANFLWPAMWFGYPNPGSSFFVDDTANQALADEYGIVVSTSHHEPMQRAMTEWHTEGEGPWIWQENKDNITEYFRKGANRAQPFESFLTLGMRGASDKAIVADDPTAVLQEVVHTQRDIIKETYGRADGERQLMALYKEVQSQYDQGLQIPDDVTLLFADDNFGSIRRLPTEQESTRKGGAGIYYHMEYVGHPRGNKWLNVTSCGKLFYELRNAFDRNARMIWVINVGDIKPQELPLTFALSMAWNIEKHSPNGLPEFLRSYVRREFSDNLATDEIAEMLLAHDRLRAVRRHEHIEPSTFSILHYAEAETILDRYIKLEDRASRTMLKLTNCDKAAFFQLVQHPIKASRIYLELRVAQEKNRIHGLQRRNSTNTYASRVLQLFDEDFALSQEYHNSLLTGTKWNHIMRQPHYGYTADTWHDPSRDLITGISYIQRQQDSNPICGYMGIAVEGHPGIRPGLVNEEGDRMQPSRGDLRPGLTLPMLCPFGSPCRYFEIYTRGSKSFDWAAKTDVEWARLSPSAGTLSVQDLDQRITVTIDWTKVPKGWDSEVRISVKSSEGDYEEIHLPVSNRSVPQYFTGFVESDRHLSIEVGATRLTEVQRQDYEQHAYLGRGEGGAICLQRHPRHKGENTCFLQYPIFIFSTVDNLIIDLYFSHTLDTNPAEPLQYEIQLDDCSQGPLRLLTSPHVSGDLPPGWSTAVQDCVWKKRHCFVSGRAGAHTIKFRIFSQGLALEKMVIDLGGVRESALGPPSSCYIDQAK